MQNIFVYAASIAPVGHVLSHAPQSMHLSASITYGVPSDIASTGHSGRHEPQAMHSSVILYAIFLLSHLSFYSYLNYIYSTDGFQVHYQNNDKIFLLLVPIFVFVIFIKLDNSTALCIYLSTIFPVAAIELNVIDPSPVIEFAMSGYESHLAGS